MALATSNDQIQNEYYKGKEHNFAIKLASCKLSTFDQRAIDYFLDFLLPLFEKLMSIKSQIVSNVVPNQNIAPTKMLI